MAKAFGAMGSFWRTGRTALRAWQPLQPVWGSSSSSSKRFGNNSGVPAANPARIFFGDGVTIRERQEAVLLERLPKNWTEADIVSALEKSNAWQEPRFEESENTEKPHSWEERVLLMKTRLGVSMGRALVAIPEHVPHVTKVLPMGATYKAIDKYEVEAFVEQCERLVHFSDDLRRLALPENFLRTITITEVPSNYGRKDIAHILKEKCGVSVRPQDVVFRFKRWGKQSDTCYVLCPTAKDADHCISQIQELAVPKQAAYGALFGAAFIWASRSTLFLSHPSLDFLVHDSKCWVFTTGWQEDLTEDQFLLVMHQLRFHPVRVVRHPIAADGSSSFFLKFERMEGYTGAKRAMSRLRRLKNRWQISSSMPFFAYPRRLDIHRASEDRYEDEDSADDGEIDEPIHY